MGEVAVVEKKNLGGRPMKFTSLAELEGKINEYFESCFEGNLETGRREQIEPFTITGLALALDTSRETLMDIENENGSYTKEYSDAIKKAKLRCQNYAEKHMFTARNPAGAIFALKNYGWKDKIETEITGLNGQPVQVQHVHQLSDDQLEQIESMFQQQLPAGEIIDI